jgi:hypothetical protein
LDLEAICQVTERETKDNLGNGEEYVGITKLQYSNMMLDRSVLRKEKRHAKHMLFLPQEVVKRKEGKRCE